MRTPRYADLFKVGVAKIQVRAENNVYLQKFSEPGHGTSHQSYRYLEEEQEAIRCQHARFRRIAGPEHDPTTQVRQER